MQISKETNKVKALVQEYNACQTVSTDSCCNLCLQDALDSATLSQILNPKICVFTPSKQELVHAYIMVKRSGEEIHMLEGEMENTLHYYEKRKDAIVVTLEYLQTQEQAFDRGAHALLHTLLEDTRQQLDKCRLLFSASSKELSLPCVSDEDSMSSADSEEDMDDI